MPGMQIMPQQMSGSMPAIPGSVHSMPGMPQQMPVSLPALPQPPQQVPKAYSTNYTVPMELMKRDRNLVPLSPMHSPHPSPQLIRKGGGAASDNALVPVGASIQGQGALLANQKLSRRTGPPVIVSTMASPDTSKSHCLVVCFFSPFTFICCLPVLMIEVLFLSLGCFMFSIDKYLWRSSSFCLCKICLCKIPAPIPLIAFSSGTKQCRY